MTIIFAINQKSLVALQKVINFSIIYEVMHYLLRILLVFALFIEHKQLS
jgi:hypothetical protein